MNNNINNEERKYQRVFDGKREDGRLDFRFRYWFIFQFLFKFPTIQLVLSLPFFSLFPSLSLFLSLSLLSYFMMEVAARAPIIEPVWREDSLKATGIKVWGWFNGFTFKTTSFSPSLTSLFNNPYTTIGSPLTILLNKVLYNNCKTNLEILGE